MNSDRNPHFTIVGSFRQAEKRSEIKSDRNATPLSWDNFPEITLQMPLVEISVAQDISLGNDCPSLMTALYGEIAWGVNSLSKGDQCASSQTAVWCTNKLHPSSTLTRAQPLHMASPRHDHAAVTLCPDLVENKHGMRDCLLPSIASWILVRPRIKIEFLRGAVVTVALPAGRIIKVMSFSFQKTSHASKHPCLGDFKTITLHLNWDELFPSSLYHCSLAWTGKSVFPQQA